MQANFYSKFWTFLLASGLLLSAPVVLSQDPDAEDVGVSTPAAASGAGYYGDGRPLRREIFIRKPAAKTWVDEGKGVQTLQGKNFAILKDNNNGIVCYSNLTAGGIRCMKLDKIK